jgi:hypothetical protein
MKEQPDIYERIYRETYGRMPKLKGVIYGEIQSWG